MKAFTTLTRRGQITRLRGLAESVLSNYNLINPQLAHISHGFNTTFRVETNAIDDRNSLADQDYLSAIGRSTGPSHRPARLPNRYVPNRYLLRVHRSGWHGGTQRDTQAAIDSEVMWLDALHKDTDLAVPQAAKTQGGASTVIGHHAGVPDGRVCSLMRWVDGRCYSAKPKPIYLYRVGELMAQLHNHAASWTIPDGFVRHQWDWDSLFGKTISFTDLSAEEVWAVVPQPYRSVLEEAATALQGAIAELGKGDDVWGLIHADLHLDNVIFAGGEPRPIDFDDCGLGYWIYDMAVGLWEQRLDKQWPAFRQAFLEGYARYRPLLEDQLTYLDIFIAAREATIALGNAAATQTHPEYLKYLDDDMKENAEFIQHIWATG